MKNVRCRGFTLVEVLIVVVLLAITAAIFVPLLTGSSTDQTVEETQEFVESVLVEKLGEEWKDVRSGDLVQFKDGRICLIADVSGDNISFDTGQKMTPVFLRNFDDLRLDMEFLFKRGDDPHRPNNEYLAKLDEFIQQIYGKRGG